MRHGFTANGDAEAGLLDEDEEADNNEEEEDEAYKEEEDAGSFIAADDGEGGKKKRRSRIKSLPSSAKPGRKVKAPTWTTK